MPVRIVAAAAAMSLMLAPAALADATAPSTLSVEGQGTVMVTPDVASLSVSVVHSAPSSPAALSAANRTVDAIVRDVRALGVPPAGIQTNSVDVSVGTVRVGPRNHRHRVRRYTATESLSVTSTSAIVGRVIDVATSAGADSIDGPDFSFSNPNAGVVAANAAALADASQQASAAAAALGYTVTGVQSVDFDPQPTTVASGSGGASAPVATSAPTTPTTLHPGAEPVYATVLVVYTIAPS